MNSPLYYEIAEMITGRNPYKKRQIDMEAERVGKLQRAQMDAATAAEADRFRQQESRGIGMLLTAGKAATPEDAAKQFAESYLADIATQRNTANKAFGGAERMSELGATEAAAGVEKAAAAKEGFTADKLANIGNQIYAGIVAEEEGRAKKAEAAARAMDAANFQIFNAPMWQSRADRAVIENRNALLTGDASQEDIATRMQERDPRLRLLNAQATGAEAQVEPEAIRQQRELNRSRIDAAKAEAAWNNQRAAQGGRIDPILGDILAIPAIRFGLMEDPKGTRAVIMELMDMMEERRARSTGQPTTGVDPSAGGQSIRTPTSSTVGGIRINP